MPLLTFTNLQKVARFELDNNPFVTSRLGYLLGYILTPGGGFTVDSGLVNVRFEEGYYVAIPGTGVAVPVRALNLATLWLLLTYVRAAAEPGYVGAWHDAETGLVHLERTQWVHDRAEAEALGRARGEKAIYDCAAGASITL